MSILTDRQVACLMKTFDGGRYLGTAAEAALRLMGLIDDDGPTARGAAIAAEVRAKALRLWDQGGRAPVVSVEVLAEGHRVAVEHSEDTAEDGQDAPVAEDGAEGEQGGAHSAHPSAEDVPGAYLLSGTGEPVRRVVPLPPGVPCAAVWSGGRYWATVAEDAAPEALALLLEGCEHLPPEQAEAILGQARDVLGLAVAEEPVAVDAEEALCPCI